MKQKLKKLKHVFAITLAGILLFGCQDDTSLEADLNQKNATILHKKFEDLIRETQFKTAFDKVTKPTKGSLHRDGAASKTIMEAQYGFIISNSPANVITANGYTSYTFALEQNPNLKNTFENLVVQIDSKNKVEAYIIKYLSNVEIDESFDIKTFVGTKTIKKIDYNPNQTGKYEAESDCYTVNSWYCYGPGHHATSTGCTMGYATGGTVICPPVSGAGNTGAGSNTTGNTGGVGGSGNNEPPDPVIVTAPTPPPPPPTVIDKPCIALKKMTDYASNKDALDNLKTKTNLPFESGFGFKKDTSISGGGFKPAVAIPSNPSNPSELNIKFHIGGDYIGIAHTHPDPALNTGYPMFSDQDIRTLKELASQHNNNGQPKEYSDYVVTLSVPGFTFAVKIKNITDFRYFMSAYYGKFRRELTDEYNKFHATESMDIFKMIILGFFMQFNAGIGLYEANATNTAWSEVILDTNPASSTFNTPILKPCN